MPSAPPASTNPHLGGVSRYDRAAGLIISLLILLGLTVAVLLFVWVGSKFVVRTQTVPVVMLPEDAGGSPVGTSSEGMTLEAPTVAEIQRETNVTLPEFRQSLAAVEDLIANRKAELDTAFTKINADETGGGRSAGTGNAPQFGSGSGRGGLSRSQRWEIRYASGDTLDAYTKELDFFGIELAAVSGDGAVVYARDFGRPKPTLSRNRAEPETRLYMQWRDGSARRESDRRLLERVGIATAGQTLVQFIPPAVEERLAQLEFEFARREARQIRKTRFAVRNAGGGFEFYVEEQTPL
jgi:hypothetical protein